MYGIYAKIGGILMVNVTIYSIHGSYGYHSYKPTWLTMGHHLLALNHFPVLVVGNLGAVKTALTGA